MASTGEAGRRVLATVLAAALLAFGLHVARADEPGGSFEVAGAIRPQSDGTWELIEDAAHKPRGVQRVVTDGDQVVIYFTEPATAVVTFVATPDETLAAQGYQAGASVGLDRAVLTIQPGSGASEWPGDLANVWFYGVLEP